MTNWFLILMIWGDAYSDDDCNRLIQNAFDYAPTMKGAVVLSDRTDRALDPRATQCAIAADFDKAAFKTGGLPVKISLFEIEALPEGTACVYVDLDSAIIGDLGAIAALTSSGPLWTLSTPKARFNAWSRFIWRISKGRKFNAGNSSVFAFRNRFPGNPTQKFRARTQIFGRFNERAQSNDDRFIGWSCQDVIRPIPTNLAVRFRMEFLEITRRLNQIKAMLRRNRRQSLRVVTFDGAQTKPSVICALRDGDTIADHHGRRGRWTDQEMGGLREKMIRGLRN